MYIPFSQTQQNQNNTFSGNYKTFEMWVVVLWLFKSSPNPESTWHSSSSLVVITVCRHHHAPLVGRRGETWSHVLRVVLKTRDKLFHFLALEADLVDGYEQREPAEERLWLKAWTTYRL